MQNQVILQQTSNENTQNYQEESVILDITQSSPLQIAKKCIESWKGELQSRYKPFNSQIKFVILLTVNYTILVVSSENLVLDQLIIPKLIFFFIFITYLVDIVLIF